MPAKTQFARQRQKSKTVNLRLECAARELIDRAAAALGKSRTEFMVEVSCREAEAVLLDRCYFTLDPARFRAFSAELDKPPAENLPLRRLLKSASPWEA